MSHNRAFSMGLLLFATAMLAIGVIHLAFNHFPAGLLPVPDSLPNKNVFTYLSGGLMILIACWLYVRPRSWQPAAAAALLWLVLLISIHLPILLPDLKNGGKWAPALELLAFVAGALLMYGITKPSHGRSVITIARYLLALVFLGFAILHYVYRDYLATLVPAWLPSHSFFAWLVLFAFLATAISLFLNILVRVSMSLLSIMFISWFLILHLPRVADARTEPEFTSLFVALAMSGIALMMFSATKIRRPVS